jgi:hypothetical protein
MILRKSLLGAVLSAVSTVAHTAECTLSLNGQAPITVIGAYSNMRFTYEHAYGFTVGLWRSGDCYFGLFLSSSGLMGDTPIGLIENMKHDKTTGAISFSARLTMGSVSPIPGKNVWEPSKDEYEFTGVFDNDLLRGVVLHKILNLPAAHPTSENVVLKSSPDDLSYMPNYPTYSQWDSSAKDRLKFRGPKW